MKRILRSIINSVAILSTCTVLVLVSFTIPDLKSREMTLREAYNALKVRVQSLSAQNEALEQENMKLIAENEEVKNIIDYYNNQYAPYHGIFGIKEYTK